MHTLLLPETLRNRPNYLLSLPAQDLQPLGELVHPGRNVLECAPAIVAATYTIIRCTGSVPFNRPCHIGADEICILKDDVCARRVGVKLVIFAIEHERHRVVWVSGIYCVIGDAGCVNWIT